MRNVRKAGTQQCCYTIFSSYRIIGRIVAFAESKYRHHGLFCYRKYVDERHSVQWHAHLGLTTLYLVATFQINWRSRLLDLYWRFRSLHLPLQWGSHVTV